MGIIDFLFPKKCLECGKGGRYICADCLNQIPLIGWHHNCYSIFAYKGIIRKAIIVLKYKYSTEIVSELAESCADKLKTLKFPKNITLVPIPMHWHKENIRGFNQSVEIGEQIAKALKWQFVPDLLIKNKATLAQVELKGPGRRLNLRGVFVVNLRYVLSNLRSLLVFDDVYTTGSTIFEANKVLKKAGVKKIWELTVAK